MAKTSSRVCDFLYAWAVLILTGHTHVSGVPQGSVSGPVGIHHTVKFRVICKYKYVIGYRCMTAFVTRRSYSLSRRDVYEQYDWTSDQSYFSYL